jgi:hypothetical protein
MTANEQAPDTAAPDTAAPDGRGGHYAYVYGIVPADVTVTETASGVGDPPAAVRLVRCGEVAALISDIQAGRPLGQPGDLVAHEQLLDAAASQAPVLPFRFGAVLPDEQSVAHDLLDRWHDDFATQLAELDGRRQFVVQGRYAEMAVLQEILSESRPAAELRDQIAGQPEAATREARIRLGEIIATALEAKRDADTQAASEALAPHSVAIAGRPPSHELQAVHLAVLVDPAGEQGFSGAIEELTRHWAGRVELRLLGPMAAYDFVGTAAPEG